MKRIISYLLVGIIIATTAFTQAPTVCKNEKIIPTITETSFPTTFDYIYESQADMIARQEQIKTQYGADNVIWISVTSSNPHEPCDGCPIVYYWKIKYQIKDVSTHNNMQQFCHINNFRALKQGLLPFGAPGNICFR